MDRNNESTKYEEGEEKKERKKSFTAKTNMFMKAMEIVKLALLYLGKKPVSHSSPFTFFIHTHVNLQPSVLSFFGDSIYNINPPNPNPPIVITSEWRNCVNEIKVIIIWSLCNYNTFVFLYNIIIRNICVHAHTHTHTNFIYYIYKTMTQLAKLTNHNYSDNGKCNIVHSFVQFLRHIKWNTNITMCNFLDISNEILT